MVRYFRVALILMLGFVGLDQGCLFAQVSVDWAAASTPTIVLGPDATIDYTASGMVGGFYDAILMIDDSGTMTLDTGQTAPNGGQQIGDWALFAAQRLIQDLDGRIRLGVSSFSARTDVLSPVRIIGESDNRQILLDSLGGLRRFGTTDIEGAIFNAAGQLTDLDPIANRNQNVVLISDGRPNAADGNGRRQTAQDVADAIAGSLASDRIDTVSVVGLPGSNLTSLQLFADAGMGALANIANATNFENQLISIFDNFDSVERLDVILPDGSRLSDVPTDLDGSFAVTGNIGLGANVFTAQVTGTSGVVRSAEFTVLGVAAVPEPTTFAACCIGFGVVVSIRRRARNKKSNA
ncbi:hypothetical protein Poly51_52740 [Rubripirellula tenax]|uniref:VWFA domain-containing protein n=1 Tax=Rubripirellula tenax TaxID=2528015 RepID=A0A5C6EG89_9BACT|nr:vWA domain-containing protein [Rubripirellula tenax]TWU47474.1 hypothetical protein Poly51_52740 [Rubripirellula tenax]